MRMGSPVFTNGLARNFPLVAIAVQHVVMFSSHPAVLRAAAADCAHGASQGTGGVKSDCQGD